MDDKHQTTPEEMFSFWMKSAMDFWQNMATVQPEASTPFGFPGFTDAGEKAKKGPTRKAQKNFEAGGKIFQSLMKSLSKPENLDAMMKGMDSVPDLAMVMMKQAMEGYQELQKQFMERAAKMGQQSKAYNFEDIDQDTFRAIRELYEKEFQKFLKVPSLGLTRFYQERFNDYLDKHNLFQTSLSEFLYMFYVPIEKTAGVMQEKLEEMAETGEIHDDFNQYYKMWVKILEGHYMTLLKSPEYTQVMDKTISSLVQYRDAKEAFVCDLLQRLPIPTNREMDELYKEIYHLKKKVRALSKQVDGRPSPKKG